MRHFFTAEALRGLSPGRAERTIAVTRIAMAAFSLFAIWLDPAEPARFASLTYFLHALYVAYSLGLAVVMWRRSSAGWLPLATHLIDIVAFSIFQYLTLGPSSPLFVYFVFALFCGAVRWGWRGAAGTAPLVMAAFVTMGASMSRTLGPTEFELNRFIIRVGYLLMVAALLVYLGRHESRLRDEIVRLARWPSGGGGDTAVLTRAVLQYAAGLVGAGRVLVVWSLEEEPRVRAASWSPGRFVVTKHAPAEFDPLVPEPLSAASFLCAGPLTGQSTVIVGGAGPATPWRGMPVHPGLLPLLGGSRLASAPFRTERLSGRAFFSDLDAYADENAPLIDVVAREIGSSLDQLQMHDQERQLAIREDRVRVARDLHDGVLQSLTGVRFELQSLATNLGAEAPDATRDRLLTMERAIAIEQRELRLFIEGLNPLAGPVGARGPIAARLEELRERLTREWKVPITLRVSSPSTTLSADADREIALIVHEAIVNALKHAHPSRVSVDVDADPETIGIAVTDDGAGFPFRGRYDHAALVGGNVGPVSLRERVAALGGEVAVESSGSGSRVEIRLPVVASKV